MRAATFIALLSLAVAACVPRHRAASIAPLAPAAESFVDDGPFRVVGRGPEGDVDRPRELTVSFSRPVRALGVVPDEHGERPPASVRRESDGAAVAGMWHWFGDRTAVFWPNGGFANATGYRVEVDRALRALDGAVLEEAPSFSFRSARPTLTAASYAYDREKKQHRISLGSIRRSRLRRSSAPYASSVDKRSPRSRTASRASRLRRRSRSTPLLRSPASTT